MINIKQCLCAGLVAVLMWINLSPEVWAFSGFYVAKGDTALYNGVSQVAIARDGNRTVLTMANDYQGNVKDFALVVPVPVVLQEGQVHVEDPALLSRLDEVSAPQLVEYFDQNPCPSSRPSRDSQPVKPVQKSLSQAELGVTVETQFSVGEYDIVMLSADASKGLQTWLKQKGYRLPKGAQSLLRAYINQNMKFFIAKVNLAEFKNSKVQMLRPLQMAFESPQFMVPIQLGMLNAKTDQDLIVYLLSPKGQTEVVNYRTANLPTAAEIPSFVKQAFGVFYSALFKTAYAKADKGIVFQEYAGEVGHPDLSSAAPLTRAELLKAGVFWLAEQPQTEGGISSTFMTRLHMRYRRDAFPEDLRFQETSNRQPFQAQYVIRHSYGKTANCPAGRRYRRSLPARFEQESQTLATLTGWDIHKIRQRIKSPASNPTPWWHLWK